MALQAVLLGVIILISGQFCSVSRAEPNVCKTYGSGIIDPFRKSLFYLKTTCPFTLTRFTLLGVNCDVTVQRGSNGLMTRVEILVNKVRTVLQDGNVMVEGNSVSLPFDHTYQHVYEYGIYIRLQSKVLPFTVTWRNHSEGVSSLWVQLDHDLVEGMTGMCGLKTLGTSLGQFVYSNINSDGKCVTQDFAKQMPAQRSEVCEVLSFATGCPGGSRVTETYQKYCSLNMYNTINENAKCAFFEEIARLCGNRSTLWPVWRQKTLCKQPTCPGDLKYQELGPPSPPTCTNPQPPSDTLTGTCLPPQGKVLNDRVEGYQCISVKDCPCVHGGKTYPAGAERNTKCQSCVCVQGKWTCSDNVCPSTCNIEGQFVTTFDGKQYSVPGKCTYVAARGLSWQVAIKFSDTDASIAEMYLQVNQDKYTFSTNSVKLGQDEITDLSKTDYATVFWQSSMFVQVKTSFGLKMKVQVSPEIQLYLYLPPTEKTTGLCGTHNNNTEDDFTTSSGIVENAALPFTQSWTVGACSPPDSSICINTDNEIYGEDKCGQLTNTSSVFARCHDYVPVSTFLDACVHRTCQCTSGLKSCVCVALSNYAKACASQGINIGDWRAETDCKISCNGNLRFSYNTLACNQTCRSLTGPDPICDVETDPVEGCGCLPGTHLNTQEECSPRALCSCYYQGGTTPPGPVVIDGRDCMCENGNLSCSAVCDCPRGKICVHCAHSTVNTAQKTCESLNKPFSVEETCTSGCYCPAGLFEDHNGVCVSKEDCTCEFSDNVYASGQSVETNCKTCICRGGQWYCEGEPCKGVCEVFGNGQYKTFDSKWYRFDGHCQYTLVEDATGDDHKRFAVRVESVPCCDELLTCSRAISVVLQDEVTLMLRDMNVTQTLKAGWQPQPLYSVHTLGLHIIISVPDLGLTVVWDKHTRVKIILQASWKGKVHGLCGNFDGKVMNDLLTSSSSVVYSPLEFGNSWKTAVPPCSDVTQEVFPCQRHSYCEAWAQRRCMILKSDTFSDCHLKVDPAPFYQACILESCSCEFEGRFLGFCTAVAAYAEACTTQNVCINWRTPDLCPVYCDYYNEESEYGWHYEPCGQMKTCGKKHSFTGRLEGCYPRCPAEMPYFDENTRKCSTLDHCTCYFNNTVVKSGDKVTSSNNCCKCVGGQIICGICPRIILPKTTQAIPYISSLPQYTQASTATTTTTNIRRTTVKTESTAPISTTTPQTTVIISVSTEIPGTTVETEPTTPLTSTTTETTMTKEATTVIPSTTVETESTTPTGRATSETIPDTTVETASTTPIATATPETTTSTTTTTEILYTTVETEPTTPLTSTTTETTMTKTTTTEIPDTTAETESTTPTGRATSETIPDTTVETASTTPIATDTPETMVTFTATTEKPGSTVETASTTPIATDTPETMVTFTATTEKPGSTVETASTTPIATATPETMVIITTPTEIPDTTDGTEYTTTVATATPETMVIITATTEIPDTTDRTEPVTLLISTTPETLVTQTATTEIPGTNVDTELTTPLTSITLETAITITTTTEIPNTSVETKSTTPIATDTPETMLTFTATTEKPGSTVETASTNPPPSITPETAITITTTTEIPNTSVETKSTTPIATDTPETMLTFTATTEKPGSTVETASTTPIDTATPETMETFTATTEILYTTVETEPTTPLTSTTTETTMTKTTTTEIPDTTAETESTTPTGRATSETIPDTTVETKSTTPIATATPETMLTFTATTEKPGSTVETASTTPIATATPETMETFTATTEIPGSTVETKSTNPPPSITPETAITITKTTEIPDTTVETKSITPIDTATPETMETFTATTEILYTTVETEPTTPLTSTTTETTMTKTTTTEIPDTTAETESTTPTGRATSETIPDTTVETASTTPIATDTPETMLTFTATTEKTGSTVETASTTPIATATPETMVIITTPTKIPDTTDGTAYTTTVATATPETMVIITATTEIPDTTGRTEPVTLLISTTPETLVAQTATTEIPGTNVDTELTTPLTSITLETAITITTTTQIPNTSVETKSTTPIATDTPETMLTFTATTEKPGSTVETASTNPPPSITPETAITITTTTEIPNTSVETKSTTPIATDIPETMLTFTATTEKPGSTVETASTTPIDTATPEIAITITKTTEMPDTTVETASTTPIVTDTPETMETFTATTEIPYTTVETKSTNPPPSITPETALTITKTTEIPDTTVETKSITPIATDTPETMLTFTATTEIPYTSVEIESTTALTSTTPETIAFIRTTIEIPGTTVETKSTNLIATATPETMVTLTTTTEIPDTTDGTEPITLLISTKETASTTPLSSTTPEKIPVTTITEIPHTTKRTESTTPITTTTPETTATVTTTAEIPGTTKRTESTTPLTTTTSETKATVTTTTETPGTTKRTESTTPLTTTTSETTATVTTIAEIPGTTKRTESTTPITTITPETTATLTTTTEIPTTPIATSIPVYTHPPMTNKTPSTSGQQSVVATLPVSQTVAFCRDPLRNQSWPNGAEWTEDCFYKTCRNDVIEMRPVICPALVQPECQKDLLRLVKDEQGCCDIWQCDCQCELYGDPHYISFSGTTFDFLDNCTYTLVKEKNPQHQLSISVDNYYSSPWLFGSSVKGVILKYGEATATLQLNPENYTVEATLNDVPVQPPYEKQGLRFESTNFKVFVYMDEIRSHVSFDPDNILQITLAMEHFRDNTVGQCGVCGGPSCIRRDGRVESDDCCNKTAYDWIEEDPLKPYCNDAPRDISCVPVNPPAPPPTQPPCEAPICELLRHEVFRECSRGVDVETLVTNCRFDYCVAGKNLICSSLQQLSEQCKRLGYCVYWRNLTEGTCDVPCPQGMIFDECRSTPDDVCQGGIRIPGKFSTDNMKSGCFCPDNKSLAQSHKTFCVSECTNCKGPLGEPMPAGAVWESNCHVCTCNNQTLTEDCSPIVPAPTPICSADSMLVSGCCGSQTCVERTCEHQGQKYKVGDRWRDRSQPCVSFTCTSSGTEIERSVCPEQSCPEELRVWDKHHCCFSCNITCAVRMSKMTIAVKGCTQEMELPNCGGYCPSNSMIVGAKEVLQLEKERRCCREKDYETRHISLTCKDAAPIQYTYHHITSCECQPDA